MKKIIIACCMLTVLIGCGNKKSNIIPEGNDAPKTDDTTVMAENQNSANPEMIMARVNAIYEAVAAAYPEVHDISPSNDQLDDAYCSSEWNTLVQMVNSKDAETMGREGFFDSDYWIMGQDWGKITISDVKVDVKDNEHANASFILHNLGSQTKVTIELIFERGEWFIGNFIDETNKVNWKESMTKHLEERGMKAQEKAADDGIIEYEVP
ncbi:MAG: DUF3828 domain-containing protein [Prevotella sp.]|nr:DUF3828 domain-containing protein [Prevotella sp.]